MLKRYFYLFILLFAPVFSVLAKTTETPAEFVSRVFRESFISGFWILFKIAWPYILLIILMKIAYVFLDNKIKKWKNKQKEKR